MTPSKQHDDDPATALSRRLEELAVKGEWQQVAVAMARRDAELTCTSVVRDEQALTAALASNERLLELVQAAKSQCAEQLGELRQGRLAEASYRHNR